MVLLCPPSFADGQAGEDEDLKKLAKTFKGFTFSADLRVKYEGIFDDTAAAFLLKPVRANTRPDRIRSQIDAMLWF